MIFEQLIYTDLGCASYLIGCQGVNEAIVVDPSLDTRALMRALERHNARLVGVIEAPAGAQQEFQPRMPGQPGLRGKVTVRVGVDPIVGLTEQAEETTPHPDTLHPLPTLYKRSVSG
jgi:hypothetical protein